MTTAPLETYAADAEARLPCPYQTPDMLALAAAGGEAVQVLEHVLAEAYLAVDLRNASGGLLDLYASRVGLSRGGVGDAELRGLVRTWYRVGSSAGTSARVREVATDLLGADDDEVRLLQHGVGVEVHYDADGIDGETDPARRARFVEWVTDTLPVDGVLEAVVPYTAETFRLDSGPGLDVGVFTESW